jgi:hypothetical protein
MAHPYCEGVVVEGSDLRAFGVAGEAAENAIGGDRGVWSKNADLEVAQFVGGELAAFKKDEGGIECLNIAIDLNVVGGEEAADSIEITFRKGGPEVLLLGDNFNGRRRGVRGLGSNPRERRDREKEEEEGAHKNYGIASLLTLYLDGCPLASLLCCCTGSGFVADVADRGVNDRVEERLVVGLGLHLDVVAYALAGRGVIGKGHVALLGGDCSKLLDNVEEGGLVLTGELPAIGDGAGEDLLGGPVVCCGTA